MPQIRKKLTDSDSKISKGGRAHSWWLGKSTRPNIKYQADGAPELVDQFDLIKKFKLKGFEYGNWVSNADRHDRLAATAKSLSDLSRVVGSKNIGLDGNVGIAFGARGKSKALAHFEPDTFMINLTKEKGFGSLAHEYGHALDYFFGMYVDQHRLFTSLVGGRSVSMQLKENMGGSLRGMANNVVNSIIFSSPGVISDSYSRLPQIEYYFRRNEIFARAFEQWVQHKLKSKGIKNTFLAKGKYEHSVYLSAKDFKRVLPLMDKLVAEMSKFMNNKKSIKRGSQALKIAAQGKK
jgi:hypothetical protein